MTAYKDYSYIKIIFNDCFESGIEVYNNILSEELEEKRFNMYLSQIQSRTFFGSFEEYKNRQKAETKNKNMNENDKSKIEESIKNKRKGKVKVKSNLKGLK